MEPLSDEETRTLIETRRAERERRNALYDKDVKDWTDDEIVDELTLSYKPTEVPPCRVCGGEMSIQRAGGGSPTVWACQGMKEDGSAEGDMVFLPGRKMADEHYSQSHWEDRRQGGDVTVMEALRRWKGAPA